MKTNSRRGTTGRSVKKTVASAMVAAGGALAFSLTPTPSAHASTTHDGCTVTPETPKVVGLSATGQKRIQYWFSLNCAPNRTIHIRQRAFESDLATRPGDTDVTEDLIRSELWEKTIGSAGTNTRWYIEKLLPDTDDADEYEEIYQVIYFRVFSNGVEGQLSPTEFSPTLVVHH